MAQHILITGASGLIGKRLTRLLLDKGFRVSHLSQRMKKKNPVRTYLWDVRKQLIDKNCLDDVDCIVHLAGSSIAEKRWTDERKRAITESRTQSIALLYSLMDQRPHQVRTIISASATGYYSDRGDEKMTEESDPATDFLGRCCVAWENAVEEGRRFGCRIVKLRTGVVLDTEGGALKQMSLPVKLGIGSPLGSGQQWVPWIHYQDVINMYLFAIENARLDGVYNMVAPHPVTNAQLMHLIAQKLQKPWWAPNVPALLLRILLGEMATVVLGSTKVSAEKIYLSGYEFAYYTPDDALDALYKRSE
ncbi:MAG: TIGR01777 family protein [Mucilaginibacter polytrichastri]|nr:TIGR01777 family protein [Mucilaginibacter polytrichastri]